MDDIDRHIVAHLTEDARVTFRQIGAAVSLSAPAVKRRIDRLRRTGIIRGFTTVLEPAALGSFVEAFVEVSCRERTSPPQLRSLFAQHVEVRAAWTVSGDADAMLRIEASSIAALERALEKIREHDTVERTRSIIVLTKLLERRPGLPEGAPDVAR